MKFGISDKSYDLLKAEFQKYPEIEKILIFGSRALGTFHNGSDIDLALFGEKISAESILGLSAKLNEISPIAYKVDLIHFETLENEALKEHILRVALPF